MVDIDEARKRLSMIAGMVDPVNADRIREVISKCLTRPKGPRAYGRRPHPTDMAERICDFAKERPMMPAAEVAKVLGVKTTAVVNALKGKR